MTVTEEILSLKKEKDAIILAHYYVPPEVQKIADYIGDSFYLSKVAASTDAKVLVFCGVSFMGESAKILNPDKTVLMPDAEADCPMAHMADIEKIKELRSRYEDLAVVCYINSTAELKSHSDVCVTSANALKIVKALPNRHILFIPDENLGRYIASLVPEKHFIFNDGRCPVHAKVTADAVKREKEAHPEAELLVHPECVPEVLALADYIGSTSGIIQYATKSDSASFIICTEEGVLHELKEQNPTKIFYMAEDSFRCPDMKKITLEKVLAVLKDGSDPVEVDPGLADASMPPLKRMLELSK
ncbi:MAG TPA: quinolinate synthase [Lachnospiraceae bacterium]|nr:quinolinate synthase [Lachnospiraceae bacterium]